MSKKKIKDLPPVILDGQMSIWDITVPKKVVEKRESFEINPVSIPMLTLDQEEVLNKFKLQDNVSRVVRYSAGSIGAETKEKDTFITHYINKSGIEEFNFVKRSPVLPWDRIIYFSPEQEKFKFTRVQTDKLHNWIGRRRKDIKRVIHRKGDENILIELQDRVIDILPNGWELEFESIQQIECQEDEVYMIPNRQIEKDIQQKVKVGDFVQASYGKEVIEGTIVCEYGLGNEILNIVFNNGTKHTAIGRSSVLKIFG